MELREFLELLENKGLMVRISKQVDPVFEISTLIKKLDGKPLLFEHVKGHAMPVISNICSTSDLVCLGLGISRKELIPRMAAAIDHPVPPKIEAATGYQVGLDCYRVTPK